MGGLWTGMGFQMRYQLFKPEGSPGSSWSMALGGGSHFQWNRLRNRLLGPVRWSNFGLGRRSRAFVLSGLQKHKSARRKNQNWPRYTRVKGSLMVNRGRDPHSKSALQREFGPGCQSELLHFIIGKFLRGYKDSILSNNQTSHLCNVWSIVYSISCTPETTNLK